MARPSWFLRGYAAFLRGWFRYGKPLASALVNLWRPREPVNLALPFVFSKIRVLQPQTLAELADWLAQHTGWTSDPLGGALDIWPKAGNIEWQLNHKGRFEDDCDGLAYLTAWAVRPLCDDPNQDYIVTVMYDPRQVALDHWGHVLNLFRHQGEWRLFSNAELDPRAWPTPCAALYDNSYYHSYWDGQAQPPRYVYVEVRSPELTLLAAGLEACSALWGCNL
jgi:hypothetical protein